MCGRYFISESTAEDIERIVRMVDAELTPGDITPGMEAPVIARHKEELCLQKMHWGFQKPDKGLIINARVETLLHLPLFSESAQHRRCVIPAAGFYEWDRHKNKGVFDLYSQEVLFLAGIYQMWRNRPSFVILTTAANASVVQIHDRMPLMIPKPDIGSWLMDDSRVGEFLQLKMPRLRSHMEYQQMSLF